MLLTIALLLAGYQPSAENLEARQWFRQARFGLLIHWGLFTVLERGEMAMDKEQIPIAAYEQVPGMFNPTRFNAGEWVALAKQAGARYITITAKHHDGFALWSTRQTPWNMVIATPYHRDVIAMLAEECRKQDIKLFFYYSLLDWVDPDYFPRGRTGRHSGRAEVGNFDRYLDFVAKQLTELLSDYGAVGGVWLDGMNDKPLAEWRLESLYGLIHSLQPAALVGNNHGMKPYEGEDFQIFREQLPPWKTPLAAEVVETMNQSWGYRAGDEEFRTAPALIRQLVRAAGHDANYLLNMAPLPSGEIPGAVAERLKAVGQWTARYGGTIYGTRGGPVAPQPWGVTTQAGNRVYVHVLDYAGEWLPLPGIAFRRALAWETNEPLAVRKSGEGAAVRLPARHPVDTILILEQ
jgi:alpha-L-fucosidase